MSTPQTASVNDSTRNYESAQRRSTEAHLPEQDDDPAALEYRSGFADAMRIVHYWTEQKDA